MVLNFREYQERFDELREDKADVVAYLKRTLMYRYLVLDIIISSLAK